MFDIASNVKPVRALSPVSVADNTVQTGPAIDLRGFNSCAILLALGGIADVDATFTVEIQESDVSGSGYTPVADKDLRGTEVTASFQFDSDDGVRWIGYHGGKRYIRVVVTPTNNASAALMSAVALLGKPNMAPTL